MIFNGLEERSPRRMKTLKRKELSSDREPLTTYEYNISQRHIKKISQEDNEGWT